MNLKTATEAGKCLSIQTRVQIMQWLDRLNDGAGLTYIQEKSGSSRSKFPIHMTDAEERVLLVSTQHGKCSYLERNETDLNQLGYII